MTCLLIDVGSTFIKYSVYDNCSKETLLSDKLAFAGHRSNEKGRFCIPLSLINDSIYEIFDRTQFANCKKAFFSVQMHGFVLRYPDGRFSDYVSWRDLSGDISDRRIKEIDFDRMGTSLKKNLPLAKLAFQDIEGEFFTLGSYIAWRLTQNNATHITDACASGFFYADTGKCNEYTGSMIMPKVSNAVIPIGSYRDIVIYSPVGDHQVSFLGSGARHDSYLLNIGTATQISCLQDTSNLSGQCEKRPYFDKNRLYTVSGLVGGDVIFDGKNQDKLFLQVENAIKELPIKNKIIIGGGGGEKIYSFLKEKFEKMGLKCTLAKNNIGVEGLKMIANDNRIRVGTMISEICFSSFPIIAKNSGLDFIIVDNEHGYFDYSDIAALTVNARLIGLDMIVRIGDSGRGHITKLADMGVCGFMLPMTNNAEDIERVIEYAKYPPFGKRGVSTTRAHTLYNPPPLADYMLTANKNMKIYAQIETVSGVEHIEEILSVPEVSGVFIGPNDLLVDMNCIGNKLRIMEAIKKVALAAHYANKPFGIITGDEELINACKENNVSMISVGSELNMLINGCKKITKIKETN